MGFFSIRNIDDFDEEKHYEACRAFYDIPREELDKLLWHHHNPENKNYFRGLTPFQPNDPAHKEMYDMGGSYHLVSDEEKRYPLLEPTPFPPQEEYQWIRQRFESHYNLMH